MTMMEQARASYHLQRNASGITLKDYRPLERLLHNWKKPVLCVMGDHEYYTERPMNEEEENFKAWLADTHPHVNLRHEAVRIGGVNFLGGTMWTDFNGGERRAM
jgi:hypothetical protein